MSQFETTRWSLVYAARNSDPAAASDALAALCAAYRPAVLAYVYRYCGNRDDAQDLTQSFFERLLAKRLDIIADPNRGQFRQFLRTAISHFVSNHYDALNAQRRTVRPGLHEIDPDASGPEAAFELTWAVTVLERAHASLASEAQAAGKSALFAAVQDFLLEPATKLDYVQLADQLNLRANTLAVSVHRLRSRMRELVRAEVAHTVGSDAEVSLELRALRTVGV
jgi:RNA polymerase sigma factor (sigma-70 family)